MFKPKLQHAFLSLLLLTAINAVGCEKKTVQRLEVTTEQPTAVRSRPCNVLIVGKESLGEPLKRQWSARNDSELTIANVSVSELIENKFELEQPANVVIYPSDMMTDLIDRELVTALSDKFYDSEAFDKFALLKHYRKSGIRYDEKAWAAPCGGPLFSMFYRTDVLAKADLSVPTTWDRLVRASEKLSSVKEIPNKIALPLGEGFAAHSFLAVSAGYVRQFGRLSVLFDRATMKPSLEQDSFVKALADLKSLAVGNPKMLDMSAADVWNALTNNELAIGMTWPHADVGNGNGKNESASFEELTCTAVPGSKEYFEASSNQWLQREGGQVLVVNYFGMPGVFASPVATRGRQQSAEQFMAWLTDPEISSLLLGEDSHAGPFRATHLGSPEAWLDSRATPELASSWATTIREVHEQSLILTFPRILRSREYMALLDAGVRKCLTEDTEPAEAMAQIAAQWEGLTEEIGRKKQTVLLGRNSNF